MPFVKKAIDNEIDTAMLTKFFVYFYGAEDGATISEVYNDTVKGGSAKTVNINRRNEELGKAWDDFFTEDDQDSDKEEEVEEATAVEMPAEENTEGAKGVPEDTVSQAEDEHEEALPFNQEG